MILCEVDNNIPTVYAFAADRNSRTFPIFRTVTGNKGYTIVDAEEPYAEGVLLMTVYRIPGETHMVLAGSTRRGKGHCVGWFA